MRAPARLSIFGAGLLVLFGGTYVAAGAAVPDDVVHRWTQSAQEDEMDHTTEMAVGPAPTAPRGLSIEQDGYLLSGIAAPSTTNEEGRLTFQVLDGRGLPVTEYVESHEKLLHLIVVRADGTAFRHVHPTMDADGLWSLPWSWASAGTYRVFADFVVAGPAGDLDVTLSRTVDVAGDLVPAPATGTVTATSVDGFDVTLTGDLRAGTASLMTIEVARDGEPVTTLEPYLGAFGHLVALREGDLAYLHVHPEGDEPGAGETSGPTVEFTTEAPTPGRYLLYLDFQVAGQVHTAAFVVDAGGGSSPAATAGKSHDH